MSFDIYKNHFESFKQFPLRPQQVKALSFISESTKPIVVVRAPCGVGKSLVGMMVAAMAGGATYLVSSKPLQHQLRHEFEEAKLLMGRNNYSCIAYSGLDCSDCTHTKDHPCSSKYNCLYEVVKRSVLNAKYKILNYPYFLFESNFVGRFSNPQQTLICDEADCLEGVMANFTNLSVSGGLLKKVGMRLPHKKTANSEKSLNVWREWASQLKNKLLTELLRIEKLINDEGVKIGGHPEIFIKQLNHVDRTIGQIDTFLSTVDSGWIMEPKTVYGTDLEGVDFKPIWINKSLAKDCFFQHGNRFILMSATFPPIEVLAKVLGCKTGDIDYVELDSDFPVENRMVYSLGAVDLTSKTIDNELPKLSAHIQHILTNGFKYKDKSYDTVNTKGIIHTVSYKINKYIVEHDTTGRIITHDGRNQQEIINKFLDSDKPLVLASPSITRGIDLKDDLGRFCIWAKMPFLSLGDKLTKSRAYAGKVGNTWYTSMAIQALEQGCGRIVRHKDDYGVSIMLDRQINKAVARHKHYFSNSFLKAFKIVFSKQWNEPDYDALLSNNCDDLPF